MMKLFGYFPRFLIKGAIVPVLAFLMVQPSSAEVPITFGQINGAEEGFSTNGGFGECLNTYAWSMVWFKGQLYVGTNRGSVVSSIPDPAFNCRGDRVSGTAEDNAAEIWRYTPTTKTWEQVFQSPIVNGVALDNGLRDMIVFEENGQEVLYVAGVTYSYLYPDADLKARILRSVDGENFEAVPLPTNFDYDSFRAFAVYKGYLFVTAGSVVGEGIILATNTPAAGNFKQVSPAGLVGFELIVWNNALYVGAAQRTLTGVSVWKTTGDPGASTFPSTFRRIVSNYGALSSLNNAVLSMAIFGGKLYVGSQTDLLRIDANDKLEIVVGNPRFTSQGFKLPVSGLPSGFGNPFTGHLWRMKEHEGWLYVGTWDTSVFVRNVLGPIARREAGFDLWATQNGIDWFNITRNGFAIDRNGDKIISDSEDRRIFNHGVRSLESVTPHGLFLGSVNPWDGTQVYLGQGNASTGTEVGSKLALSQEGLRLPGLDQLLKTRYLKATRKDSSKVSLSWVSLVPVAHFDIYRATYDEKAGKAVQVSSPEEKGLAWKLAKGTALSGPYEKIGESTSRSFTDSSAAQGVQYAYYVQAVGSNGQLYKESNTAIVKP